MEVMAKWRSSIKEGTYTKVRKIKEKIKSNK
jgi:hypothetical protein